MKTSRSFVWILLLLLGCEKAEIGTQTDCTDYLTSVYRAESRIRGEWQLAKVSAFVPTPTVPDVKLVFDYTKLTVYENGHKTNTFRYQIVKNRSKDLELRTDAESQTSGWRVRNARLSLCQNRLFLDTGMAVDGPGYDFHRTRF